MGVTSRVLAVGDVCTRECLALVASNSTSSCRVAPELDAAVDGSGKLGTVISDNGTEYILNHNMAWPDGRKLGCLSSGSLFMYDRPIAIRILKSPRFKAAPISFQRRCHAFRRCHAPVAAPIIALNLRVEISAGTRKRSIGETTGSNHVVSSSSFIKQSNAR